MRKGSEPNNLSPDVLHLIEQLERHCLAPDGSLVSLSAYYELQSAREEMLRERLRYLEAMALYSEAAALVEEYQEAVSAGGMELRGVHSHHGLRMAPQFYESLEKRLVVAEAAQKLRLPFLSKDGEINEDDIEKTNVLCSSLGSSACSSSTSLLSLNSTNYNLLSCNGCATLNFSSSDPSDQGVGGVPDRFLGLTPEFLWKTQLPKMPSVDMPEYQMSIAHEIEARLKAKCERLADALVMDETESYSKSWSTSLHLPERVKLTIEEMEREETALREDLSSADRQFAEYYNVLEEILGVLIKLVKDLKLQHQHQYDELRKTWLCKRCETMNAKLRVMENLLLRDTYTKDSVAALHKIRKYLLEAIEEASVAYNKAPLYGVLSYLLPDESSYGPSTYSYASLAV